METVKQFVKIEYDANKALTQQVNALNIDEEMVVPIKLYYGAKSYISGRLHKTTKKRFETSIDSATVAAETALIRRLEDAEDEVQAAV